MLAIYMVYKNSSYKEKASSNNNGDIWFLVIKKKSLLLTPTKFKFVKAEIHNFVYYEPLRKELRRC